jgi:hypothetical protein
LPKGVLAGVAAGLAAAFVMSEVQALWTALAKARSDAGGSGGDPSTLKAADQVSISLSGEPVPEPARKLASSAAHYMAGAALGGVYGAMAEFFPGVTQVLGVRYAGVVWITADEMLVPLLGLAPPPTETKVGDHVYGFVSHAVFGAALEFTRRAMATVLSPRLRAF